MGIRDEALGAVSRRAEPLRVNFGKGDRNVLVRELGTDARMAFIGAMQLDAKAKTGSMNMAVLLPFVTDLIADPETGEPVFEKADHETLVANHPGVVQRVIFKSVDISDIGADAITEAEGNSEPTPS